ncbi:hypothetical protein CB1_000642071 [Camelus ferus]|nr:hypothetical protein CB1_000642071 [Camelus ferus]
MAQGRERDEAHNVAIGSSLSVRWVQGFPKQNVHFVNDSTICYPCGNFVIFLNIETKKKTVLQCMNGIVGIVATNVPYEVVAFSDRRLRPLIYIYNFPGLTRRTKLKGNVLLDYTLLSFSYCGTYLASYSSLPEFELALWSVKLPMEDGSFFNETDVIFPQSLPKDPIYGPVLPVSAIAGLVLDMMKENKAVDNIAKLEQQEFGLDLEELERLHDESEEEVAKLQKEIVEAQSGITLVKKHNEEEDEEEEDKTVKDSNLPNYLLGSLSTDFRVHTSLLSSQLELHSREEKINQIILLKDIIYKVKTAFNNEFDAAYKQKEIEIARIKERNVRIHEIILDLDLQESVWQPEFEDCEKPERTLVVENAEIRTLKHVTAWQKAKTELLVTHEMEQWLVSQGSNLRRQALMDMMGGVLEVKKEDILRMVIPQPAFMAKPETLWSEEERKKFKEYEKKVKELNEERDKYRKSLEAEMKKLQNAIQESTQSFDEHLKRLFEKRVKAEMVVNQEELKINNLVFSLLLDEEISSREAFLNNYLTRKQEEKSQTAEAIRKAREDLDVYKEHYDNLVAEDKVKQKAAGLMEMAAFLRRRTDDDEKVQHEIEKVFHELIL